MTMIGRYRYRLSGHLHASMRAISLVKQINQQGEIILMMESEYLKTHYEITEQVLTLRVYLPGSANQKSRAAVGSDGRLHFYSSRKITQYESLARAQVLSALRAEDWQISAHDRYQIEYLLWFE